MPVSQWPTRRLGIVTDRDFRHRVATGEVGVDAPVTAVAVVPVLTIDETATHADALLRTVEHAVHYLVVTDRGGQLIGVVRAVDLAQSEVRDPLVVRAGWRSPAGRCGSCVAGSACNPALA